MKVGFLVSMGWWSLFLILVLTWPSVGSRLGFQNDESSEEHFGPSTGNGTDVGLSPPVGNLAANAIITSNATCGEREAEIFCKLVQHVNSRSRTSQCQICDARSPDRSKRHPISYAIDGSDRWWQSPSLQNGRQFEWVTITIDLRQAYQVAYIVIKAALSPRPGNWILEKSLDGIHFFPWQYYAISDKECWIRYGVLAKPGKPTYNEDDEVICTSYFSKISPLEGGEIHTSLVNGRPGAGGPSEKLVKFTIARYVRLRLQKIRTLHADLMGMGGNLWDKTVMRRYFYSIKDIAIGGHCVCFGHSSECVKHDPQHMEKCLCRHNTCGENCDMCCPLYNQYPWGPGNSTASAMCEKCQCYGHADACVYDPEVNQRGQSLSIFGHYAGGGVCLECKAHTTGINCEKCQIGYYRPLGVALDDPNPCVKCECTVSRGNTGTCITQGDDVELIEGKNIGDCHCNPGFTGKFCTECALGFHGYPKCLPCPCNLNGILNLDCEGDCICKSNVEGLYCSKCKPGYFDLDKNNPLGCTQCFCHGVSLDCQSSNFTIREVRDTQDWVVSDLHGTKIVPGILIGDTHYIANEEFASFETYYWTSKEYFFGNRIDSYGLRHVFDIGWVQARGDTSGRPIVDFDVIIQSKSSMLGFNRNAHEGNNATISLTLTENGCYILPDVDNTIAQNKDMEEIACARYDVMEALSDIKRVLVRAKFHTDQIEGMLNRVLVQKINFSIDEAQTFDKVATSIEICACPKGYTGYSCENCDYGYRKSSLDSWLNECIKCDCNGHSPGCETDGTCYACEHNTTGSHCETCIEGLYGDPRTEDPNSCKLCACPLSIPSNNFSPTCITTESSYVCTNCPIGYEGPFCERCSNGYFGNPIQAGDSCKPCTCNTVENALAIARGENICDRSTGECFLCPKNTVGWSCDECRKGFYGNPSNGSCLPCSCNIFGSASDVCNVEDGQCECNERFTGRACDSCIPGCGNVEQSCPPCSCDPMGSKTLICDQQTGQCDCKNGVTGRYCNQCLEFHYGFSDAGCEACNCHINGSDSSFCDLVTGQCHCLRNVENRNCNACASGYWNIDSGRGCDPCDCDVIGSTDRSCDQVTSQCHCHAGIGGRNCSECLPKHYGFSASGCKPCDPCTEPGHICNEDTGRCVCPPNAEGLNCSTCSIGFWGDPTIGCQACNCSPHGSISPQCFAESGQCPCFTGYSGIKCDLCTFGFYNYPTCTSCGCEERGTVGKYCDGDGLCSCDQYGQCPCKKNVIGPTCNKCKEGSYGLSQLNIEGCSDCFCFQRTNRCSEGTFKWEIFGLQNSQTLSVRNTLIPAGETQQYFPYVEGQDHCYVYSKKVNNLTCSLFASAAKLHLALPNHREVTPSWQSRLRLSIVNNLIVIPESGNDVLIENGVSFSAPLYWQLPQIFLGDKVLSYNGYLRFRVVSETDGVPFPYDVLSSYPLVQIQGNHRLILEYFPNNLSPTGYYEVKLNGDFWRLKHGPSDGLVTKEIMMVALQNLQHILIRGTSSPEIVKAKLYNVSIDIAVLAPKGDLTDLVPGIEVCQCPPEYNSTSCQNPKRGYYRWHKKEYITSTVIIDLIGEAKPCQCNGRSNICDTETGFCQKCQNNTGGKFCNECAKGFYGNPLDRCLPCPCPTVAHGHADSCYRIGPGNFQCFCRKGYMGKSCDRCDYGYYGNPSSAGSSCEPCHCNIYGSVSDECHEVTGQCNCRKGITGRDCTKCAARNVIMGKSCISCDDDCTGILLDDMDQINRSLSQISLIPDSAAIWLRLHYLEQLSKELSSSLGSIGTIEAFVDDLPTHGTIAAIILARAKERNSKLKELSQEASNQSSLADTINEVIQSTLDQIQNFVWALRNYALNDQRRGSIPEAIAQMAALLNSLRFVSMAGSERMASAELSKASEAYKSVFNAVFQTNSSAVNIELFTTRLDDLNKHINQAVNDQLQADRLIATSRELLGTGKAAAAAVHDMILDMDLENLLALDKLNRGSYVITEMNQVLMMTEDIVRDLRNLSKGVELQENMLYELIPLYRVRFAQPAFDHVKLMEQKAKYMEGLFSFATSNSSTAHQAITAYARIEERFQNAYKQAKDAANISKEASVRIQTLLRQFPLEDVMKDSDTLIKDGFTLRHILEQAMRDRLAEYKDSLQNLKWRLKGTNEAVQLVSSEIDLIYESHSEVRIPQLIGQIEETLEFWKEVDNNLRETEMKIERNLKSKVDEIKFSASFNPQFADNLVKEVTNNSKEAHYKALKAESIKVEKESKMADADDRMKRLKALISQAKHKAQTVRVSVGPDATGICFRLYKWPVQGGATSITFNFAPIHASDSLLFYWPSSITDDFVAIELMEMHIKASWDLGSGVKTIIHPLRLVKNREDQPDDPDVWYHISFERVSSDVSLGVHKLDSSGDLVVGEVSKYPEIDENATVMNLSPEDLIHIGGISNQRRPDLVSNGLSGCIHNLRVNHETLGLWNFVGNEGCAPCTECSALLSDYESIVQDYYFDGRGYSIVKRIQSQAFYSKVFDINMEFRTYAETGLLFFIVNEAMGQSVSLQIQNGQIIFKVRHSWKNLENAIHLETTGEKLNTGKWIKIQALWVYQKFLQTGQLSVADKQYTQQIESTELSLNLDDAPYQVGGLSPEFYGPKWHTEMGLTNVSFVGCLKNLLIDGNAYDPLSNQYFGVEAPCGGKKIYITSFEGNGYAEYPSRPMTRDRFKFGFSFKTTSPSGLLFLSAFTRTKNPSGEPYYAVYLENGELNVQINLGNGQGLIRLYDKNENRYDNGKIHDVRVVKKQKKFLLYMDDEAVGRENVQTKTFSNQTPSTHGLFLGGASLSVQESFSKVLAQVMKGFAGCIENLYFGNEILNFNHPVSHLNQNLGDCPPHFNSVLQDTFGSGYFSRIQTLAYAQPIPEEQRCSSFHSEIEHEDLHSALHFGDSPDSYVAIQLEGSRNLRQHFNFTFHFRTFYPHGLFFQGVVGKRRGGEEYHILSYLKDGQFILKFANRLWSHELVSVPSNLNDGSWHMVSIIKAGDRVFLYIDSILASEAKVTKRMKQINKLFLGGIPAGSSDFLENSIQKPDQFKGCIKKLSINSHEYELNASSIVRHQVNPCFKNVESGSFFGGDSYAVYMYNFTFNNPVELELEFRTNSKYGDLLTFVPDFASRQSSYFSIYLEDGQVVASETSAGRESRAVESFAQNPEYICDGGWHSVKANFIGRSISLKVDSLPNVDSLLESTRRLESSWREVTGTLFIGGHDGRSSSKRSGFHGCIKNISINQYRKDWSDMAVLSKVFLNSCPN